MEIARSQTVATASGIKGFSKLLPNVVCIELNAISF